MKKQNENHQYNSEIKMIYSIKNMTVYIEWHVTRRTVWHTNQKTEEILFSSIKKISQKERNKMSNLKCWKDEDNISNKWIFREI